MSLAFERAPVEPHREFNLSPWHSGSQKDQAIKHSDSAELVPLKSVSPLANEVYALLPRASEKIARICAEMLTSSGHMTQSLAFAFLARSDRSSLTALAGAQTLPTTLLLHRVSS